MAFMAAELALLRAEKVERDAELARCHKRIRRLESLAQALPQPVGVVGTGSVILDSFMTFHVMPYPKDARVPYRGLRWSNGMIRRQVRVDVNDVTRWMRQETDIEFSNKGTCEYQWCQMLGRIGATCRSVYEYRCQELREYRLVCSFRAVAKKLHYALNGARDELLDNRVWPPGYHSDHLEPQGMIGETYANLDAPRNQWHLTYPGLRGALAEAQEADEDEEDEDE